MEKTREEKSEILRQYLCFTFYLSLTGSIGNTNIDKEVTHQKANWQYMNDPVFKNIVDKIYYEIYNIFND